MIDLIVPLASAAASALSVLAREGVNWYKARIKLKSAAEREFQEALTSDSLKLLGDYLDRAVGQFSVAEYAHNPEVKHRVNMFLARVEDFVGKTEDVQPGTDVRAPLVPDVEAVAPDAELRAIEERVLAGSVWDGLAHLRRLIEQRLRHLALERRLKVPERPGATRLMETLRRHAIGSEDVWEPLRYVIHICNRGVHGLEVSTSEALEAIGYARRALHELGLTQTQNRG